MISDALGVSGSGAIARGEGRGPDDGSMHGVTSMGYTGCSLSLLSAECPTDEVVGLKILVIANPAILVT